MKVGPVTSGHRLADCLSSFDVARHYSRLHVLVCGFCHSVFHVIDEFRSHTNCCAGTSEAPIWASASAAAPGLAIVLWTDTVLRWVVIFFAADISTIFCSDWSEIDLEMLVTICHW